MNWMYFSQNIQDYTFAMQDHASRLANSMKGTLEISTDTGRLAMAAKGQKTAEMTVESYDPALEALHSASSMTGAGTSIFPGFGVDKGIFDSAGVSLLPLRHDLEGMAEKSSPLVHYFIRPLRLKNYGS